MEIGRLIPQLFEGLRKQRSREQCARILGVDKSTIYKWENGLSKPSWSHLISYLKLNKIDFETLLKNKTGISDWNDGAAPIAYFCQEKDFNDVVEAAQVTRQTINNILQKKQVVKVEIVFRIWLFFSSYSFVYFLDQVLGLSHLEEVKNLSENWDIEIELSQKYPFLAGVIKLLERGPSRQEGAIQLTQYFDIQMTEASELIEVLLSAGIVNLENGYYTLAKKHLFDSGRDFKTLRNLHQYWTNRAIKHIPMTQQEYDQSHSHFSYLIFSLSDEAQKAVHKECVHFHTKLREIDENDKATPTGTYALTVQLSDFLDTIKKE